MQYKTRLFLLKREFERSKDALWEKFLTSDMGVRKYTDALRKLEERHQLRCIDAFMEEMEREESR